MEKEIYIYVLEEIAFLHFFYNTVEKCMVITMQTLWHCHNIKVRPPNFLADTVRLVTVDFSVRLLDIVGEFILAWKLIIKQDNWAGDKSHCWS